MSPSLKQKLAAVTPAEIERSASDSAAVGKIIRERPTWDSLAAEFRGAIRFRDNPNGTREARIVDRTPDRRLMRRLHAMGRRSKMMECDLGSEIHSRMPVVAMKRPSGDTEMVPAHIADSVGRKGGMVSAASAWRARVPLPWASTPVDPHAPLRTAAEIAAENGR